MMKHLENTTKKCSDKNSYEYSSISLWECFEMLFVSFLQQACIQYESKKRSTVSLHIMVYNPQSKKFFRFFLVIPRLDRGIQILRQAQDDWIGACSVLDTEVKPDNDSHWNRFHQTV